jgi:ATP-dependent DNA helicase RecQ
MVCDTYLQILKKYWGYDSFRGIQSEIIESITSGNDTLGLMPTGGGKSVTFQVPALAMEGVCIVITPLIALMNDQVQNLHKRGIKAEAIHSELSQNTILRILENAVFGAVKLLYVSPERLSSELFRTKLRHMKVSFVTIDEAHCISQWGYDFRPSYLRIADIRKDIPNVPILALTATATPLVIDDIQDKLQFRRRCVFRMSFDRRNLVYCVRRPESKMHDLVHILRSVNGSAIIYARTRQRTRLIAKALVELGFQATFYHANLDTNDKKKRQQQWQQDNIRIIVATNAFGMGIDKADVRLVVHFDCPDSLEAYYQEAGRAGRDGKKAYAVLLYSKVDSKKLRA